MTSQEPPTTLDPDFVLLSYARGYFPMADPRNGRIAWYSPDPRAIIPFESYFPPRSLRRSFRKKASDIRINTHCEAVIRGCADRPETWISEDIVRTYLELHKRGFVHTVECWQNDRLMGGLYGVSLGGAVFGESMFSREPNASKIAFWSLVDRLKDRNFTLLDTQFINEHVRQFGAIEIPRVAYLARLRKALEVHTRFD